MEDNSVCSIHRGQFSSILKPSIVCPWLKKKKNDCEIPASVDKRTLDITLNIFHLGLYFCPFKLMALIQGQIISISRRRPACEIVEHALYLLLTPKDGLIEASFNLSSLSHKEKSLEISVCVTYLTIMGR